MRGTHITARLLCAGAVPGALLHHLPAHLLDYITTFLPLRSVCNVAETTTRLHHRITASNVVLRRQVEALRRPTVYVLTTTYYDDRGDETQSNVEGVYNNNTDATRALFKCLVCAAEDQGYGEEDYIEGWDSIYATYKRRDTCPLSELHAVAHELEDSIDCFSRTEFREHSTVTKHSC